MLSPTATDVGAPRRETRMRPEPEGEGRPGAARQLTPRQRSAWCVAASIMASRPSASSPHPVEQPPKGPGENLGRPVRHAGAVRDHRREYQRADVVRLDAE